MASIGRNWRLVNEIIACNGDSDSPDEPPIVKIVSYNNQFNGELTYAIVHANENPNRYEESAACHNVVTVWRRNHTK